MKCMRDKDKAKELARKRIARLFKLAKSVSGVRAKRYVKLACEIARKMQVKLTRAQRRGFCKKCYMIFLPGDSRVRIKKGMKIVKCGCGAVRRFKV